MARIYVLLDDYTPLAGFRACHGASYWIELDDVNILFDTGPSPEPVLHNASELGLELRALDYVVLSHCHYDHTGGLLGLLRAVGRKLPVIAHPELFRPTFVLRPRLRYIGAPFTRAELEELAYPLLTADPLRISNGVMTSGEVAPREEFERGSLEAYTLREGRLVEDELRDDVSLLVDLGDGLAVITGCAHAGVVSILKHAPRLTGKPVRVLLGGLHLRGAPKERVKLTIEWLKKLGVEEVYAGHCTGLRMEGELARVYGCRFRKLYSGMVVEL